MLVKFGLNPVKIYFGSLLLNSSSKEYLSVTGLNSTGQLGTGGTTNRTTFAALQGYADRWLNFAGSASSSAAIKADGTLWAWGDPIYGQLGNNNNSTGNEKSPILINNGPWSFIECGRFFAAGIKFDGTLWMWGLNSSGQVGNGVSGSQVNSPTKIGTAKWSTVSCSFGEYTMGIQTDGTLWAWGGNQYGNFGNNSWANSNVPVKIGTSTWRAISTGYGHTAAIRTDNTLWVWGLNAAGQIGDGSLTSTLMPVNLFSFVPWRSVAAAGQSTFAIKADGTLWAWGGNGYGQLGDGTTTGRLSPVQIAGSWKSVSAGFGHVFAVKTDNTLWAWGLNSSGQLGDGTTVSRTSPVQIVLPNSYPTAVQCGESHTFISTPEMVTWS
jgi:alpha-tubulin suppressor-like RCC1 family protein